MTPINDVEELLKSRRKNPVPNLMDRIQLNYRRYKNANKK